MQSLQQSRPARHSRSLQAIDHHIRAIGPMVPHRRFEARVPHPPQVSRAAVVEEMWSISGFA